MVVYFRCLGKIIDLLSLSHHRKTLCLHLLNFCFTVLHNEIPLRTGDGDPPENACIFWRKIRSKDLNEDYLKHLEFALLGLGDTNYTTFLGYPKSVEKQLQKLGAKQFYKSGWADDAVGLEIVVDPWIENLWPALENQLAHPHTLPDLVSVAKVQTESSNITSLEVKIISKVGDQPLALPVLKEVEEELEKCLVELASLKVSVSPLSECDLKVPLLPVSYLELKFNAELMVSLLLIYIFRK